MRAVDTNLLVRLLVRDDVRQVAAAESFVAKGAWVLDAVYDRTPAQLAKALELLLNHSSLTLQDADVVGLALKSFRAKPALGFSDCLVLEIARKAGHLPLGTFDKPFSKLDGAALL